MQPTATMILTRSERQAMDWSLVLVSQGIESSIAHEPEENRWGLIIAGADYERAMATLKLYRTENRRRTLTQEVPWTGLLFDWRAVAWFVLLILVFAIDVQRQGQLRAAGLMDNKAVSAGETWRLVTATMLHNDVAHLAANATTGILLLGLAMGQFGAGYALLAAVLSGVGGNVAGWFIYPETHRGLGASGLVMGALGLLTAESIARAWTERQPRELIARGLMGGFLLLILLGFSPDPHTDVLAHVAGFVTGLLMGGLLSALPRRWLDHTGANRLIELLCACLVVSAWWWALKS